MSKHHSWNMKLLYSSEISVTMISTGTLALSVTALHHVEFVYIVIMIM